MKNTIEETTRLLLQGTLTKDEADKILLSLSNVVGQSELLIAFLDYADPIYWGENECTDRRQLIDEFLKSKQ